MDKKTSLYESHIKLNAKIVNFAEYLMPIQYDNGVQSEYMNVRNDVGVFDVSHMGIFNITGIDSENFLNNMLSNDILRLENEKAMYTLLCNKEGGVIDDLIVYKINDEFILIVNASNKAKDLKWLNDNKHDNKVNINDISSRTSLIAIQGPNSRAKIEKILDINLDLDFYSCKNFNSNYGKLFIARTGYTGELGFEILADSEIINNVWDKMISANINPIGLAVRDILRIEMGYCLYGHEIDEHINPLDARLGWIIDEKSNFIGSKEIDNIKNQKNKMIFFKAIERAVPRQGLDIYVDQEKIGFVTSGTFSYQKKNGLGIGFIKKNINNYNNAYLLVRGKRINIDMSNKPFMLNTSLRK